MTSSDAAEVRPRNVPATLGLVSATLGVGTWGMALSARGGEGHGAWMAVASCNLLVGVVLSLVGISRARVTIGVGDTAAKLALGLLVLPALFVLALLVLAGGSAIR